MGGISGAQGRQGASLPPRLRRTPCPAAGRSPARRRPRRRLWPSPAPAGASPRLPAATGRAARRGRAPAGGSRAPRLGGGGCAAPAPPGPPAPSPAAPVRPARPDPASPRAEPGQAGLAPHTPAPRPGSYRNPPGVGAGGGGAASQPRRRQRWPGGRGEQPAPRHGVPWGWTVPIPPATGCQRCCLLCWRSERPGGAAAQGQSPAPWGHKAKAVGQPSPPTWPHAPELPPVLAPSPPRHKCRRERAGALPRAPCSLHPRDQRSGSPHPTLSCPLPACVSLHHPRDTAQPPRSVPARLRGAARAGSAPC